jgi:polyphosphate kinase 2
MAKNVRKPANQGKRRVSNIEMIAAREGAAVLATQAPDAPPITFGKMVFDLDNPYLPEEIEHNALASGGYPYDEELKSKLYLEQLRLLQIELVKMQKWVNDQGKRIVVLFEGRDAAGKGGTIATFLEYMNPRSARHVALTKPSDVERGQWYFQRYANELPTRGEIVLFDRSWYNRGVVEPVMGFCSPEETDLFLSEVPNFERMLIHEGIVLVKIWLDIGREMQLKRFHDRRHDPLRIWKLSPVDLKALAMWDQYTVARDRMLKATHSDVSPWIVVRSNDKKRARLNAIRHVLGLIDYDRKNLAAIGDIDDRILGKGPKFLKDKDGKG